MKNKPITPFGRKTKRQRKRAVSAETGSTIQVILSHLLQELSTNTTRQVTSIAETVAKQLKEHEDGRRTTEKDAEQNTFTLLMARFDRVDDDNKSIKDRLETHVADDLQVHAVVARHGTYWGLLIGLGGPLTAGVIAWFQGLFK